MPALALVAAAAVRGSTFVLMKQAIRDVPPLELLALRFSIGAVALALVWRTPLRGSWRGAGVVGLCLAAGYAFQTFGLRTAGASEAAFITGLFVVFTPLLQTVVERTPPTLRQMLAVVPAVAGLALLTGGAASFGTGQLLVLLCAVAFAAHFVAQDIALRSSGHRALAVRQLLVAAAVFTVLAPAGGLRAPITGRVWLAIGVTSLGATAFAFAAVAWAQTRLSPTRTALVATMEPVFAGLFGAVLLGERLTARQWAGAALILVAMLSGAR